MAGFRCAQLTLFCKKTFTFLEDRYRLGVKHALEYGHLLEGFDRPIVTRTTSEDRMFESGWVFYTVISWSILMRSLV